MISAIVLTKNEEKNIEACLESLKWCEEIIIIDDYSEDKTIEKCQKFGKKCRVYRRHLGEDFASQRNFGLRKARGEWVIFLDADERIPSSLAKEICRKIKKRGRKIVGFYFRRWDYFGGKWLRHGEIGSIKILRLAKRNAGKWIRKVHEIWKIKGKTEKLNCPLLHYPHQTIREFLFQINFYSTLHAESLKEEGRKPNVWRIIGNPLGKFIKNYFLRLGFLDGIPGLIVALMMSFHSFLSQAKLYLKWKK